MAHSRGPWSVEVSRVGTGGKNIVDSDDRIIAAVHSGATGNDDATLLAAAPDLLATLLECRNYMGDPMRAGFPSPQAAVVNALIRNIRDAIAKAGA